MARLFRPKDQVSAYRDRRFKGTQEEFQEALQTSTTVYIGNLSFYTTEEQIYEVFSRTGEIKRIVMGLDKNSMTPCGFCFVMYYTREDAEDAVKFISGTILDERPVRVDFDWGFQDGRQWGRGRSGGQGWVRQASAARAGGPALCSVRVWQPSWDAARWPHGGPLHSPLPLSWKASPWWPQFPRPEQQGWWKEEGERGRAGAAPRRRQSHAAGLPWSSPPCEESPLPRARGRQ